MGMEKHYVKGLHELLGAKDTLLLTCIYTRNSINTYIEVGELVTLDISTM